MSKFNLDPEFIDLIKSNFVSFGPNKVGPNILVIKNISEEIISKKYLSK